MPASKMCSNIALVIVLEDCDHSVVGGLHILHLLIHAPDSQMEIGASVAQAIVESDGVAVPVVLDHGVQLAEHLVVLFLLADGDLLRVGE